MICVYEMATPVEIRPADINDSEQIASLIRELAENLKTPEGPRLDAATLRKDGFGAEKMFMCFVAEVDGKLIGHAMYYYSYSSWNGACVFLEDLYVKPDFRSRGIGSRLLKAVAKAAVRKGCSRLELVCLDWNKQALEFYKGIGTTDMTDEQGFHLLRLSGENLREFASTSN